MSSRYATFGRALEEKEKWSGPKGPKRHKTRRRRRKRHSNSQRSSVSDQLEDGNLPTVQHPNTHPCSSLHNGGYAADEANAAQLKQPPQTQISNLPPAMPMPVPGYFDHRPPLAGPVPHGAHNYGAFSGSASKPPQPVRDLPQPGIAPSSMPNDFVFSDEEDAKNLAEFFHDVPDDVLFEIMQAEEEAEYLNSQAHAMEYPVSMQRFDDMQRFENVPGAVYSYHHVQSRDLYEADETKRFTEEADPTVSASAPSRGGEGTQSVRDYSAIASRHRTHATRMDDGGVRRKVRGHVEVINRDPDAWDSNREVCSFFLRGVCMYGESCRDAHRFDSNECPSCHENVGYDILDHQIHMEICPVANSLMVKFEEEASKHLECGICHESPVDRGKQFGLLTECNHPFCLDCIRKWRGVLMQSKDAVRGCPMCRKASWFIVPCERMVSDPIRKKQTVLDYKKRLATIPCRHFAVNEDCPFGTSCFYKHVKKDGTVEVAKKLRHVVDANGNGKIVREYTLRDHLTAAIGPQL